MVESHLTIQDVAHIYEPFVEKSISQKGKPVQGVFAPCPNLYSRLRCRSLENMIRGFHFRDIELVEQSLRTFENIYHGIAMANWVPMIAVCTWLYQGTFLIQSFSTYTLDYIICTILRSYWAQCKGPRTMFNVYLNWNIWFDVGCGFLSVPLVDIFGCTFYVKNL